MNLLSWNCHGSEGATILTLNRYLHATRAHLAFISETKCNEARARSRISRLPLSHSKIIPSTGRSGGLWLLWLDDISITMLERSFYFLFIRVDFLLGSWILGLIYGDPHHYVTDYIWNRILHYSQSHLPLCLVGDFNSILMNCDKFGRSTK